MSNDIANRGEILLYDITISILETVRQDTMYISEFDPCRPSDTSRGNNHEPSKFELNKARFEAVTACLRLSALAPSTCTNIPHGLQELPH